MLDIVGTVQATTVVEPSQISLGESEFGPKTVRITVKNEGSRRRHLRPVARRGAVDGPNTQRGATPTTPKGST